MCMDICVLRSLKEELAWATGQQLLVLVIMLFKTIIPLRGSSIPSLAIVLGNHSFLCQSLSYLMISIMRNNSR